MGVKLEDSELNVNVLLNIVCVGFMSWDRE